MFHALAIKMVVPEGRSKKPCTPSAPQFMKSSVDFDECYTHLQQIAGSRTLTDPQAVMHGVPVFVTTDWAYFIVHQD